MRLYSDNFLRRLENKKEIIYSSQTLERARFLDNRVSFAHFLEEEFVCDMSVGFWRMTGIMVISQENGTSVSRAVFQVYPSSSGRDTLLIAFLQPINPRNSVSFRIFCNIVSFFQKFLETKNRSLKHLIVADNLR